MEQCTDRPAHVEAYRYSLSNKTLLANDSLCGCYHCLKIFEPTEIKYWLADAIDGTAICPYCGIDTIIGESSGFPINTEFLQKMHNYWL